MSAPAPGVQERRQLPGDQKEREAEKGGEMALHGALPAAGASRKAMNCADDQILPSSR